MFLILKANYSTFLIPTKLTLNLLTDRKALKDAKGNINLEKRYLKQH